MTAVPVDIVALTRALVDIDSTTGREGEAGRWLADYLRHAGYTVTEQPVDASRFNVVATAGASATPSVVFSTHFDCVPPFFPSRVEGDRLYGRGACDAKGILAAQVAAADLLRRAGETRVGLLFVVGEERGSDGAKIANEAANGSAVPDRRRADRQPAGTRHARHSSIEAPRGRPRRALVVSRAWRIGHRQADRRARRAAGDRAARRIRCWARRTTRVGLISGGVAPNVVSPWAEAEVMFRTVSDGAEIRQAIAPLEQRVAIEHVLEVPPVRLRTVPGFDAAVFPYTTDIPFLARWGEPLLFGPGSINLAHTADEFVSVAELRAAVDHYVTIARALLNQ